MKVHEKLIDATDPEVKGIVRLELIDPRTRRVTERVEIENDISQWWQLRTRRFGRSLFFAGNPNQTAFDIDVNVGLNTVYLSSSAESLGEPLIDGSTVAYAGKDTYSGGSLKRGTIIAAECLGTPTSSQFVWEWATTAGNGVIRSVGFCDSADDDTRFRQTPILYRNEATRAPLRYMRINGAYFDPAGAALWIINGTNVEKYPTTPAVFEMVDVLDYIPGTLSASVPRANIGFGSNTLADVTGDGTNIYVAASTSSIKKFTAPTGIAADPTESTISVSGRTAMVCLAHDGSYLWVSEGSNVYRVHPTTGVIERSFAVSGSPNGMWWYPERSLLLCRFGSEVAAYDLDGNNKISCTVAQLSNTWASIHGGYYLADHTFVTYGWVYVSGYARNHEVLGSFRTGTRTVLGAEVEKTNLTGMKLTYTFTFS